MIRFRTFGPAMRPLSVLAITFALGTASFSMEAAAAPQIFDDESDFLSVAQDPMLETFDGAVNGQVCFDFFCVSNLVADNSPAPNIQEPYVRGTLGPVDAEFTFSMPLVAFGVTIHDALDSNRTGDELRFITDTGVMGIVAVSPLFPNETMFFGIIDTMNPFMEIIFDNSILDLGGDNVNFDNVYFQKISAPPAVPIIFLFGVWLAERCRKRR